MEIVSWRRRKREEIKYSYCLSDLMSRPQKRPVSIFLLLLFHFIRLFHSSVTARVFIRELS